MTDYLALLHADEPENTPPLPTAKTAKSPFDSKDSDQGCRISGAHTHYSWLVQSPAGALEVSFSPEATHEEVTRLYPEAHIAPMLESANTHEAHHE